MKLKNQRTASALNSQSLKKNPIVKRVKPTVAMGGQHKNKVVR